jgi:hypothetical protein
MVDDGLPTVPGERPRIFLKIREYIGPDTLGFAGRQLVFSFQSFGEFPKKQICQSAADGTNGIFNHFQLLLNLLKGDATDEVLAPFMSDEVHPQLCCGTHQDVQGVNRTVTLEPAKYGCRLLEAFSCHALSGRDIRTSSESGIDA